MPINQDSKWTKIFFVLLGGFVLCFQAFYNKYPLMYFDTGSYMLSGFSGKIPMDRPLTYGLFLRHTSLAETTWFVILAQGIIVSLLIYYFIRYFIRSKHFLLVYSLTLLFLLFFSGLSVNVSQLIPDVFALVFILSLALLLIVDTLAKRDVYVLLFLAWLGMIMHNAHPFIAIVMLILISLFTFWKRAYQWSKKRLIICWAVTLISVFSIPTIHYLVGKEFVASKGSHVFIMAHLVEIGILDQYLKDNCDRKTHSLCAYQNEIPTMFIWNGSSPLRKIWKGEDIWLKSKAEFDAIIYDIMTTPKYWKTILYKSIFYTAQQFVHFDAGTVPALGDKTAAMAFAKKYFPHEYRELQESYQIKNNQVLNYDLINTWQKLIFVFSLCLFTAVWLMPSLRQALGPQDKQLIGFVLIALLCNAFICSNLSTVLPRYQSRIFSLYPLVDLICIARFIQLRWPYKRG
ncbi:MAG: hypothetical protein AAF985_14630 [Bacteroidota bacterium]